MPINLIKLYIQQISRMLDPMFERCLYFNVNALARSVNRMWNDAYSEFNLSPSHAYLLRLVSSQPGLTPKQICLELKLEKSTISRFLDALVLKGLIRRKKGVSGDAREQGIFLTKKSAKISFQLEQKGDELYQKLILSLGKPELTSLVNELRKTKAQID